MGFHKLTNVDLMLNIFCQMKKKTDFGLIAEKELYFCLIEMKDM